MHVLMLKNGLDTLEKIFKFVSAVHTSKRCFGTRKIISEEDEVQPNGRLFKKYNMGEYQWMSFTEAEQTAAGMNFFKKTPKTHYFH